MKDGQDRMRKSTCFVVWIAAALSVTVALSQGGADPGAGWTVSAVLKEMDQAMKDNRPVKAQVRWDEMLAGQKATGTGTMYVDLEGKVRAEVGGDNPRTVLALPPFLHVYRPLMETVENYYTPSYPDLLAQYVLVGWVPSGGAIKKQYKVKLLREETLDDRNVVVLSLDPKSKPVKQAISSIVIWIDTATWLPAQQLLRHSSGGMQVTVRYLEVSRDDDVSDDFFQSKWPPGTQMIKHWDGS